MVKMCVNEHLTQCVEIAFAQNNLPETNCAFCPSSRESICRDFEFIINNPDCLMVGYFVDDQLVAIWGCFLNLDNKWVDCVGPFFKKGWNHDYANSLFSFSKATLCNAVRFNFYFNAKNKNYHTFAKKLSADRQDNEYILLLRKADYTPQEINHLVVAYSSEYEAALVALHDSTFPNVYVTGEDIVSTICRTRDVFCVLDESGAFTGYGVLKCDDDKAHFTAEIFAVKKEARGKGYGWALLNMVVGSAFNKHNCEVVDLVVDKLNANARDLYYSCGFRLSVENKAFSLSV